MIGRGFTLIELIVAVAIISLLASIIIDGLGQKRNRGSDASVQSNITNARPQAELYYANNNKSYDGVCIVGGLNTIGRFVQAAKRAYGGASTDPYDDGAASAWNTEECHDTDNSYVIWVPLRDSASGAPVGWCADSRNIAKRVTTVLQAGDFLCPP